MKTYKIVLAGGNGYLGNVLMNYFDRSTHEIVVLSRKPVAEKENVRCVLWDGKTTGSWTSALEGADLLINFCGKNVNCRYTEANRREILQSRLDPTNALGAAIALLAQPPACWINISSATIYRHAEDRAQTEDDGEIGYGFSIDVCKQWEACFFGQPTPSTRKIALRLGIVLGRSDGAFPRLLNLSRFGLGGSLGTGTQYISWIHEQDAAACIEWLWKTDGCTGVYNATAPDPVPQHAFMKALRSAVGVPFGLGLPAWLLEIGAWFIGTETELLLKSRWVLPERLQLGGYVFRYPALAPTLRDLIAIR